MTKESIDIWLDDERDPTDPVIKEKYGSCGAELWIKTGEELLLLLNTEIIINSISLDHDLGSYPRLTGYDVSKEIEERCYYKKMICPKYSVHSSNPIGSKRIEMAMMNAERYSTKKNGTYLRPT